MNIWKLSQHTSKDVESKVSDTKFHRENICTPLHSWLLIFFIDLDFNLLDFALKVAAVTVIWIGENREYSQIFAEQYKVSIILYKIKCFLIPIRAKS